MKEYIRSEQHVDVPGQVLLGELVNIARVIPVEKFDANSIGNQTIQRYRFAYQRQPFVDARIIAQDNLLRADFRRDQTGQ